MSLIYRNTLEKSPIPGAPSEFHVLLDTIIIIIIIIIPQICSDLSILLYICAFRW